MITYAKLALLLFQLGDALVKYLHDKGQFNAGFASAVAQTLSQTTALVERAHQVAVDADAAHAAHPADDDGFDHDFERKDA